MKTAMIAVLLWFAAASALGWERGGPPEDFVPGARLERSLEELGLEPEKLDGLRALIASARREGEEQRERLRSARQELHALLEADAPDEAAVLEQVERLGELRTEAHKSLVHTLLAVRAQLTPEQREQLRAKMREDLRERRPRRFRRG
jgi:Spy/CpxP family protein refolding chaperone